MNPGRNILVIRLGAMGDVIHALPAVASLKHTFPTANISWLIKPHWIPLLEGNPSVDEIIPFERTVRGLRSVMRRLRREPFDTVVDFQGLLQSALLARAARARRADWRRPWKSTTVSNGSRRRRRMTDRRPRTVRSNGMISSTDGLPSSRGIQWGLISQEMFAVGKVCFRLATAGRAWMTSPMAPRRITRMLRAVFIAAVRARL